MRFILSRLVAFVEQNLQHLRSGLADVTAKACPPTAAFSAVPRKIPHLQLCWLAGLAAETTFSWKRSPRHRLAVKTTIPNKLAAASEPHWKVLGRGGAALF